MSLDQNALRSLMGSAQQVQMVPRELLQSQMDRQETLQNVNIAFSIANSETVFKHAADGSSNARTAITAALYVLAAYMQGLVPEQPENSGDESGTQPSGT